VRKADNLPPSCAVVTKSGNLNFLEPFGPVQVRSGTALPTFIRFVIPVVFIIKLDWSVCICLTKLYDSRDMYSIYYINSIKYNIKVIRSMNPL